MDKVSEAGKCFFGVLPTGPKKKVPIKAHITNVRQRGLQGFYPVSKRCYLLQKFLFVYCNLTSCLLF